LAATAVLLYEHWSEWVAITFWAVMWVQAKFGLALGSLPAPGFRVWLQAALVLLPLVVHKTLVNATFDAWTTADVERLLRRAAGGPAAHWAVVFAVLVTLTLLGPAFYVWPIGLWKAVAATAVAALILAWIAPAVHRRRIDARFRGRDDGSSAAQ
jgi:hypothetical protein